MDGTGREGSTADFIDVVQRFCDTWSSADVDALVGFFADDAVCQVSSCR